MFLATEATICYVTSLNGLKNGGVECKKVRASDSNDYFLYSFSEVKSFIKLREEGTIVRNTINSEHLEFMLYIREGKHWSCDYKPFSKKKNISSATSVLFVRKAVAHDNTGSIEILSYNDVADEIRDGKCYKILNLTLNTCKSERILKSSCTHCSSWIDTNARKRNER